MESPPSGRGSVDDEIQPISTRINSYPHFRESQDAVETPLSPTSGASFGADNGHDSANAEEIISPGPVRTVQVQRHSVLGGKPRYVIADIGLQDSIDQTIARTTTAEKLRDSSRSQTLRNLDTWLLFLIIAATVVILGMFAFLSYLWIARDSTWHTMVNRNWIVRTTTLATSLIWIAVQCQVVVAGLLLFCLFPSAVRYHRPAGGNYISLRKYSSVGRSRSGVTLAVFFIFLTIALQFLPTILFSDFENGLFASGTQESQNTHYSISEAQRANLTRAATDSSLTAPTQFPAFGEVFSIPSERQPGVDDTGETVRALIPIASSADRSTLATYQGLSTLMNSRVICLAPTVGNITYTSSGPSTSPSLPTQRVDGSLSIGSTAVNGLEIAPGAGSGLTFACNFELAQNRSEWPATMCSVQQPNGNTIITSPFSDGISVDTSAYLLLNHTANNTIPISASAGTESTGAINITQWDVSQSGFWTNLTFAPNPMFSIQLSLCFVSLGALDVELEAIGTPDRVEPSTHPRPGGSIYDEDVDDVLLQLGVIPGTHTERGIFSLTEQRPWGSSQNPTSALDSRTIFGQPDVTYGLCTFCGSFSGNGTSPAIATTLSIVFQRAIHDSGSPAKALQALFTLARSSQYYSRLPYFDLVSTARVNTFQIAYHPHHNSGLIAAGALLLGHLMLVALITALFLMRSTEPLKEQLGHQFGGRSTHSRSNSASGEMSSG